MPSGEQKDLEELDRRPDNSKECGSGGRKVKPILPLTPSHFTDRKTSRTDLTSLKPAEDYFFFLSP